MAHKGKILTVLDTLATTYNDIYPIIVLHWERRKHAQSNFAFYLQINLTDVYFLNFQQQLSNNEILLSGQYYGMIPSFPWEAFHDLQLNIGLHEFESWNYIAKVASNCIDINLVIRKPEETLFYSLLHSFKVSRFLLFFFLLYFPLQQKARVYWCLCHHVNICLKYSGKPERQLKSFLENKWKRYFDIKLLTFFYVYFPLFKNYDECWMQGRT